MDPDNPRDQILPTEKESDRIFHCQTQQAGFELPIHFPFQNSILFQYSNLENLLITGIHFCNRCKHLTPQQVKQAFCQAIHKTGLPALESNPIHFYYSQNWIRTLNNGLKNKCKGHVLQYLPSVLRGRMSHCRSEMLKFRGREEYISDGNL